MSGIATMNQVVLECPDPAALADFYSKLLGWPVVRDEPDWATVRAGKEDGMRLSFQQAPGYQPPVWPDPASSMQFHLDVTVPDLDRAEMEAQALGAVKMAHQPEPDNFRVYADPVGHIFCLCIE
jgi:catechol 2,3-dioxygenase-like lactoylglutathione lyase family enzyme